MFEYWFDTGENKSETSHGKRTMLILYNKVEYLWVNKKAQDNRLRKHGEACNLKFNR